MEMAFIALGACLLVPLLYVVVQYNQLVGLRNYIRNSWSNIDTELKRRYELIPAMVETVKGYAAHEADVFRSVTELRARCLASNGRPAEQAADERQLVHGMQQLLAVAENYPQLKADAQFTELHKELVNTEDRIQAARRFFNGNVRDYRVKRESFPSSVVASMFNFGSEEYFSVEPSVRDVPNVDF
jgi:LemA protein